ncbi:MAG TPA: UbiA family prenyltransferase [Polyangiaceae bacterium]|nr:UbiA family prenyltransferase [Polyangiaceae bacterium]
MNARAWLELCRAPNVFTAVANVAAGVLLARLGGFEARDLLLLLASAALYLSGMILNDVFDRKIDAIERPTRPIPSKRIGVRAAALAGGSLALLALAAAALHGLAPLLVALALVGCIIAYDAWLKDSIAGPFTMGGCRALNLLLGLSVASWASPWVLSAPLALGAFTTAVTFLSRSEVHGAGHARPFVGAAGATYLAAVAAAIALSVALSASAVALVAALALSLFLLVRGVRLYRPLWSSAEAPLVGRAIGGSILLMPALDALFVAAAGQLVGAALVFALTLPALLLKRWFYMT